MATIRKHRGRWQAQVRRKGHTPLTRSFAQKADATAWARQTESKIDRRDLPPDTRALGEVTLEALLLHYETYVTPRKRGAETERVRLRSLRRINLAKRTLTELRPQDFAVYRDDRLNEVSTETVRRELGILRHVFEIARTEWDLPLLSNPAAIKKPPPGKPRERRLCPQEFEALSRAVKKTRNKVIGRLFRFVLETGMRRGEALQMEWRHIDADKPILLVPTTKNGHARRIPLSPAAQSVLEEMKGHHPIHIFPITANALRLSWTRLCKRAGIADFHFHDLRHEAISRLFEKGWNVPEVALMSGHRDPRMLFRYTHLRPEDLLPRLT